MSPLELLNTTVEYYSKDTNRRCSISDYSQKTKICAYNPKTISKENISEGCAIGRHLDKEFSLYLDQKYPTITIREIFSNQELKSKLPEWMKKINIETLQKIQILHDSDIYWEKNSVSQQGKIFIEQISNQINKS